MSDTAKYFIDLEGNYLGAWDGYTDIDGEFIAPEYPSDGIEIGSPPPSGNGLQKADPATAQWLPFVPASIPYQIAKTTPWKRMTDEEAELITGAMQQANARQKAIYDAASYLSSDDPLWSTLHDMIAATLGSTSRADELLAPET